MLCSGKTCREHICGVERLLIRERLWNLHEIEVGIVDMEILCHIPIFLRRELVPAKHTTTLRGEPALTVIACPTRGDRIDSDTVACLKPCHILAYPVDDTNAFMSQSSTFRDRNHSFDCVYIGRTNEGRCSADDSITWPRGWNGLLNNPHFSD